VVTGKPNRPRGFVRARAATGRGLVYLFREAAPAHGLAPSETRFAAQGFGNVGSRAVRIMQQLGATMVAAADREEFLRTPCDVFIPAALGGMIHADNADLLDCRMVIKGANSPTTSQADEILNDKGIFVIPDAMA
jgi:glutamate dehydrogenase (NAD(P)+)